MHLAHWSITQTKNRETEPSGIGWELFDNYLIALKKYKPDFFLYENNKSMAPAIRAQITRELGVKDSPVAFHADGHTVHDFDPRFQMEDDGLILPDDKNFRWAMLDQELNYRLF